MKVYITCHSVEDIDARISELDRQIETIRMKKSLNPKLDSVDFPRDPGALPVQPNWAKYCLEEQTKIFERYKVNGQWYGVFSDLKAISRGAFRERHNVSAENSVNPSRYIQTKADADEIVQLFKTLCIITQAYIEEGQSHE